MTGHRLALLTVIPEKHTLPAAIDPAEHAAYVRTRHPDATLASTSGAVLVHQNSLLRHALASHPAARRLTGWASADLHLLCSGNQTVVLCSGIGAGAPATALVTEQLVALGIPAVISIGTAAALTSSFQPGDIVLCDKALRGEGTSAHYLPPSLFAYPHPQLSASLGDALSGIGAEWGGGPSWTTDALYRESATEVDLYAEHGILTVDMEAAGLFAVGHHRHLPTAAAFAIADCMVDRGPRADSPLTGSALQQLLAAAFRTLTVNSSARRPEPDTVVPHPETEQEAHRG